MKKGKPLAVICPISSGNYLTAGKRYPIVEYMMGAGFKIACDTGYVIHCLWNNCAFMSDAGGKNWISVYTLGEEQLEFNFE